MVHLGGQDQICPNFRQSPLRPRSSALGARNARREDQGAKGAEEGWVWGGGVPLPTGERSGEGAVPPPQKIFLIFELKKASFGASLVLFFLQLINLNLHI